DGAVMALPSGAKVPSVIASSQYAYSIFADEAAVYWGSGGDILRAEIPNGKPTPIASPGGNMAARGVTARGAHAYWISYFQDEVVDSNGAIEKWWHSKIMRSPVDHSAPETLLDASCNVGPLTVEDDAIYFAHQASGTIVRLPLAGGP